MKRRLLQFFRSTSVRLAATYLVIIMAMSIGFSVVFYNTSLHELRRQVPPRSDTSQQQTDPNGANNNFGQPTEQAGPTITVLHDFLAQRAAEARRELLLRLFILNVSALVAGGVISYYLARRTLKPIEDAMEAQARFVSDASHELRTPLTAIRTMNDVALRNKKLTLGQAKDIIRDNTDEAIKLKVLSDGLLDLAKHGHTTQSLTAISLQAAVSEAINQVIPAAQNKAIAIDDQVSDEAVLGNQSVAAQMLVILLDNAIKYSPAGSTITLSSQRRSNHVLLQVKDQGIGIRASDLPHIFSRFYRSDTARSDSHKQGYGLGLAIADTLAKAHEASLSAQSQVDSGSTFTLTLRRVKKTTL